MNDHRKVHLHPPSSEWAEHAQRESERFAALLGSNLIRIHHIGSTAIPGIAAKPTIDLLPEVKSIAELDLIQDQIEKAGYEWRGEYGLPGRRFCVLNDEHGKRKANIHCYETGSDEITRHLVFRDYLIAHPDLAKQYEAEKLRCQSLHPDDVFAYSDAKDEWIKRIEKAALDWKSPH